MRRLFWSGAPMLLLALTMQLRAADPPPAKDLLQPYLPSWLEFNLLFRGRVEAPLGIGFTPGSSDVYYASRLRFNLGVKPTPWMRFFAQAQDSRAPGYGSGPVPVSTYDPWDLRQAYVELSPSERLGFQARVGRQELHFGSGHLLAAPEWSNTGKSFDAARLSYARHGIKADLFAGSIVQLDAARFDRHKPGEHLYGTYVSLPSPIPSMTIEPYLLARTQWNVVDERGVKGNSHLYTGGGRVFGKTPARFDYSVEIMRQWGYVAADSISATAGAYTFVWTAVPSGWKPRLSFEVNHASGDDANRDGRRNTFDQLYAGLHSYYGIADQVGERNIRQYKAALDVAPSEKFKASVDFRELYLASVEDGLYNLSGTRTVLNRNATSSHVGSELDLQGSYLFPGGVTVVMGYGKIFAGSYLKQSTGGGGYQYPYLMWNKRF